MADQTSGSNGSKSGNGRDRNLPSCAEAQRMCEPLLELGATSEVQRFDAAVLVRRVELKENPTVVGKFLFLAILDDGRRYEGARCWAHAASHGVTRQAARAWLSSDVQPHRVRRDL